MNNIILIAHNIRSLFNIGSLFRSADCFGVSKIYLTGYTAQPPRKEISKTALGADQTVPWEYSKQLPRVIRALQSEHVTVVGLETSTMATSLPEFILNCPPLTRFAKAEARRAKGRIEEGLAFIVGNEVTGLTPAHLKLCNHIVQIPMLGSKESLNVAIAASIAMYAIRYSKY